MKQPTTERVVLLGARSDLKSHLGSVRWFISKVLALRIVFAVPTVLVVLGENPASLLSQEPAVVEMPKPAAELLRERGAQIFSQSCADCHGASGQGDESAYDSALVGDDSIGQLAAVIADTMPEGSPEDCVGEDAEAVASFIHYAFYSEAAQIRNRPPQVALARLTADQLRQSVSDLYSKFSGLARWSEQRGVNAIYFNGDRWKDEEKKIERTDAVIDFDFGRESPGEGISAEEFFIHWTGGLLAEVTGRYEIIVRSTCSFTMDFGSGDRELIDNHVQSGDKTEFRKTIYLTGGRVYPFEIDFRQRKRKTESPPASVSLSWVPPGGVESIIPTRNLVADWAPAAYSLQAILPPDDRSYGYERGIAVSREWDESTTAAAIEFGQIVHDELWPVYQRKHRKDPEAERVKLGNFLAELLSTAFRMPLSTELRELFVDKQLAVEPDDAEAIKRVVLIMLKSPRFLYPQADGGVGESQQVANRLSLVLFDSLPADDLTLKAIEKQTLKTPEQIRGYVEANLNDYRVRAKTREMLYSWLNAEHLGDHSKDAELYPGFDKPLAADLKLSLDAFLDAVVWSDRSDYRELFLSKAAYTTPRIAEYYGDEWAAAEEQNLDPHGVQLARSSDERFGILTHPYLLSGLAYHDSTSPIHRGVFLIRYVLGRTLRPPSDAFSPLSPDLHPDLTTRQRVELQTSPASCQVCHTKINGLGFALESFDAVGKRRELEGEKQIDANGSYTDRDGIFQEFDGVGALANFIASSPDAHRAFVSRVFQHFVKQPPAAFGTDTLERLTKQFEDSEFNIKKLIVEVALIASQPSQGSSPAQVASQ